MSGELRLDHIDLRIGDRRLVTAFSLTVGAGEIVTVTGPSGCGKSALLAYIGGQLDPAFTASGRVLIGEKDMTLFPAEQRRIGHLFQDDLLFPHLSVGGNLAFGLAARIRGRRQRGERVEACLREAGLAGFAGRPTNALSGGQRARVGLLRTLLAEPVALLLDEPFNGLDSELRADFRQFVFSHARSRRLPVILVTHDRADAQDAGGPVLSLGSTAA
jgi:putative thiamine transport system ATP-binding protein